MSHRNHQSKFCKSCKAVNRKQDGNEKHVVIVGCGAKFTFLQGKE